MPAWAPLLTPGERRAGRTAVQGTGSGTGAAA
jgi:hypothetical protein